MGAADRQTFELFGEYGESTPQGSGGEALRAFMLTQSPKDRSEYARTVSVNVDGFRRGLEFTENLIQRSTRTTRPGGLWIIGDGGVGKTFIVDTIHRRFPPTETPLSRQCRVLRLTFASRPVESDILLQLLLQLGQDPNMLRYQRNADLEKILLDALPACGTLAILFDEANHLWINTKAYRVADRLGGRMGDFLKRFYDQSGLAYIFAGTSGLQNLLAEDSQASTRWSGVLKLTPFCYDNIFIGLLAALDEALPMTEKAGLASEELAPLLFESTQGNFRTLKNLLAEAVYLAASEDCPRITQTHLAQAHFNVFCSEQNPFK